MKRLLTLLFLIVAIGAKAQMPPLVKVTSIADGNLISKPQGGVEISPIPSTLNIDSIRTYTYSFTINRDTTQPVPIQIWGYNRSGNIIYQNTIYMVGSTYKKWKSLLVPMDAYIAGTLKRITQLTQ